MKPLSFRRLAPLLAGVLVAILAPWGSVLAATNDGDALPTKWEKGSTPKGLNLKALGAKPARKDIFVEIDFGRPGLRGDVTCGELDKLFKAFKDAPVNNPNGSTGVTLHLDAGKVCSSRSYKLGGSDTFDEPGGCATFGDAFGSPDRARMSNKRAGVFHHAAIVDDICGGSSGIATQLGSQLLVKEAGGGGFPHIFMHELGHNLGLDHDPWPNHLSVMASPMYKSSDGDSFHQVIDYQRFPMPSLDESALSEPDGFGADALHPFFVFWYCPPVDANPPVQRNHWPGDGPIDWNCSAGTFDPPDIQVDPVAADINGDGQFTVIPAATNEWKKLSYSSGGTIGP
jgi:hypothetical protein